MFRNIKIQLKKWYFSTKHHFIYVYTISLKSYAMTSADDFLISVLDTISVIFFHPCKNYNKFKFCHFYTKFYDFFHNLSSLILAALQKLWWSRISLYILEITITFHLQSSLWRSQSLYIFGFICNPHFHFSKTRLPSSLFVFHVLWETFIVFFLLND